MKNVSELGKEKDGIKIESLAREWNNHHFVEMMIGFIIGSQIMISRNYF